MVEEVEDRVHVSCPYFPVVQDQTLYSKTLLKTISFDELKESLDKRSIVYYSCDSYHVLRLKLQIYLLAHSNAEQCIIAPLRDELNSLQKPISNLYSCPLDGCPFKTVRHISYINHLRALHSTTKAELSCQLKGCKRVFFGVSLLLTHIKVSHRSRISSVKARQTMQVESMTKLKCPSALCGNQVVESLKELKVHMKWHFERLQHVPCIYTGCSFETDVDATFRSHCSKKHRHKGLEDLKFSILCDLDSDSSGANERRYEGQSDSFTPQINCLTGNSYDFDYEESSSNSCHDFDNGLEEFDNFDIFMRAIANSFNDWMHVKHIPYSTCNILVQEVFNFYSEGKYEVLRRVRKILLEQNLPTDVLESVLSKIKDDDPFLQAKSELESEFKRLTYIKDSFEHIEPVTVRLGGGSCRDSYQYIPICQSLKVLLEDQSYINQKREDPYYHDEMIVRDVRDGHYFRNNAFFQKNHDAVPLMLFQDELEVVNPLGSGKTKHKINCTYYTTYDIQGPLRSKTRSIQLVSLVSSKIWKNYGTFKTNSRLLDDLLVLETEGIVVSKPQNRTVKAGLAVIIGDNLGLHQLGEYNAVFSSGNICRVCDIEYDDLRNNQVYSGIDDKFRPSLFTPSSYDEYANCAVTNGEASQESKGIKAHCMFNQLESFHCTTGMPPCLGKQLSTI